MASKLVLASIGLIAVGLILMVVGDPSFRAVTGGGFSRSSFPGNFTSRTFTIGTFTSGNFTGSFPTTFRSSAGIGMTVVESLAGVALVGAGLLLEIFSIFIRARPVKPAA